jgi:L-ascorbate 6-phosphate lactonase
LHPDILIPCINGRFGNLDEREAAMLTKLANPDIVIPSHFGMFVEQNGQPSLFLQYCKELAPSVRTVLMEPGEELLFQKKQS